MIGMAASPHHQTAWRRQQQEWLHRPGRNPLVLRGARQVGKSTLVRLFCDAETDRDLLTVNLERHPHLAETFAGNDPATILNVIEAVPNRSRSERTVLFLDEIQAVPAAFRRAPLLPRRDAGAADRRRRFADGVHAVGHHAFPMPVGRIEYLDLGPMTFSEFLRIRRPHRPDRSEGRTHRDMKSLHQFVAEKSRLTVRHHSLSSHDKRPAKTTVAGHHSRRTPYRSNASSLETIASCRDG